MQIHKVVLLTMVLPLHFSLLNVELDRGATLLESF